MPVLRKKVENNEQDKSTVKKRQKKPINVVAVITPDGIKGSFMTEMRRPLIAHLNAHSSQIDFKNSEMNEPEPYDSISDNTLYNSQHETVNELSTPQTPNITPSDTVVENESVKPLKCHVMLDLMSPFKETMRTKSLPDKTDIACFWCVHNFDTQPCVIPEREVNNVYSVYGNFCMPECALAYILHESIDQHVIWERIALLHRIYDRMNTHRIFPSPPRESLKIFGGPLTIEAYRATVRDGKVRIDMHMPPMVSILGSIDTKPIDFFDSTTKHIITSSANPDKPTKVGESYRLSRSKPLKDKESTLDSVLNIRHVQRVPISA